MACPQCIRDQHHVTTLVNTALRHPYLLLNHAQWRSRCCKNLVSHFTKPMQNVRSLRDNMKNYLIVVPKKSMPTKWTNFASMWSMVIVVLLAWSLCLQVLQLHCHTVAMPWIVAGRWLLVAALSPLQCCIISCRILNWAILYIPYPPALV